MPTYIGKIVGEYFNKSLINEFKYNTIYCFVQNSNRIANQTTSSRYGLFLLCQLRQPTDIGIQVVIHHESDYRISVFSTNVFPFAPNRL